MTDSKKCSHVIVAGKVGTILGMLSRLGAEQHGWSTEGWAAHNASGEDFLGHWALHISLPCYCPACYDCFTEGAQNGRNHRIRTEDFPRLGHDNRHSAVQAAVNSKLNQAIVSLLPTIYPRLLR